MLIWKSAVLHLPCHRNLPCPSQVHSWGASWVLDWCLLWDPSCLLHRLFGLVEQLRSPDIMYSNHIHPYSPLDLPFSPLPTIPSLPTPPLLPRCYTQQPSLCNKNTLDSTMITLNLIILLLCAYVRSILLFYTKKLKTNNSCHKYIMFWHLPLACQILE